MRLINGAEYDIPMDHPEIAGHFADPYNYTKEIMAQFDNDYYKDIIFPGDTLLDIGANVGLFSLHVYPYFKKIIAVEPTPSHFQKLRHILKDIKGVQFENSALAGYTGETTFYWCGINTTMNSLQNRSDRQMQVACITLLDLLNKYGLAKVDMCKIDIEGSEDLAITVDTLQPVASRIRKFFIELHPPNQESQAKFENIFREVGYDVTRYIHDSLICIRP